MLIGVNLADPARRQPKLSEKEALQKGLEAETVEFVKQGAEIYKKA